MVLEDYGALKFVDKKFQPALKLLKTKKVPADTEYGYVDKPRHVSHARAGRGSKIDTVPLKAAGAIFTELEKPEVLGVIISSGSTQLMIVVQVKTKASIGFDTSYTIGVDYSALHSALSKPYNTRDSGTDISRSMKKSDVTKMVSAILKGLKEKKLPAELHIINADVERQELKVKRETARRGVVPRGTDEDFNKKAKAELRARLDRFKSGKAVGVDKIEELVAAIREKGYLDKIKIGGFVYDLKSSDIRMDNLKKPNVWNKSYVEYSVNTDTPEYAAMQKKWYQMRKEGESGDEAYEAFSKTKPPGRVKILLKLEKGVIVPAEIETEVY